MLGKKYNFSRTVEEIVSPPQITLAEEKPTSELENSLNIERDGCKTLFWKVKTFNPVNLDQIREVLQVFVRCEDSWV